MIRKFKILCMDVLESNDYYQVLGLNKFSEELDIGEAYRR